MRRWLARMGLVVTLLIAGVYVASGWWSVWRDGLIGGSKFLAGVHAGSFEVVAMGPVDPAFHHEVLPQWYCEPRKSGLAWWFRNQPVFFGDTTVLTIPLWAPLLLTAIATFFLWPRPFRRPRPGHCRACGYDLKGAPSSTCPECGKGAA